MKRLQVSHIVDDSFFLLRLGCQPWITCSYAAFGGWHSFGVLSREQDESTLVSIHTHERYVAPSHICILTWTATQVHVFTRGGNLVMYLYQTFRSWDGVSYGIPSGYAGLRQEFRTGFWYVIEARATIHYVDTFQVA